MNEDKVTSCRICAVDWLNLNLTVLRSMMVAGSLTASSHSTYELICTRQRFVIVFFEAVIDSLEAIPK